MKKILLALTAFITLSISVTYAQEPTEGESLDKVVAIVGSYKILNSDVMGQVGAMAQMNPNIDIKDPKIYDQILNSLIDQYLIVQKAVEDSVEVSEEEISMRWEIFLQSLMQRLGSESRIEKIYKMSIERLKFESHDQIKTNLLAQKMIQKKFGNVEVSPHEIDEFYEKSKDSISKIPESIELYQIVRNVAADKNAKEDVFKLALKVRDSLIAGGDFAYFAKKYSSDPATANSGGELGWFDKGKLVPEFEKAAFNLAVGEISMPVETPFGFHIIQTLDKKPNSVKTRHILFKIGQSGDDREKVKNFLDSLRNLVMDKDSSFEELARRYSDDKDTRGFGGLIGKTPIDELSGGLKPVIDTLKDGQVSQAVVYQSDPTKFSYRILYRKKTIPAHEANLKQDYDIIKLYAGEFKKRQELQKWINKLRDEIYWEKVN